jgi:DNA-binding MarR family transcriptional regulator
MSTAAATSFCNHATIRKATRRLGQLYDDALTPSGLRGTQFVILAEIASLEGPTLRELAQTLVMDLSALGHTLKPLIRDGYVELAPDPSDRRAKRARLTAAGTAKLDEMVKLWRTAQGTFEAVFGAEKAADLRSILGFLASETFNSAYRREIELSKR